MAGYAKAWTDIFDDEWFVGLSNYDRGIWLQLFIYAKQKGDTGTIIERKLSICAALMSCDVRIFRKSLARMQSSGKLSLVETATKAEITIHEYEYYQRLKKVEPRKSAAKVQQKCSTNAPIRRADKTREEQTKEQPELAPQELADLFNSICTKYPRVVSLKTESQRYKKTKSRLAEHPQKSFWERIFNKVQKSELMLKWGSFDWTVQSEANLLKIHEGNYDKREGMTLQQENEHYERKRMENANRSGGEAAPLKEIISKVTGEGNG